MLLSPAYFTSRKPIVRSLLEFCIKLLLITTLVAPIHPEDFFVIYSYLSYITWARIAGLTFMIIYICLMLLTLLTSRPSQLLPFTVVRGQRRQWRQASSAIAGSCTRLECSCSLLI